MARAWNARRPVEQMRLLFCGYATANVVLQVPPMFTRQHPIPLLVSFVAGAGLVLLWWHGVRRHAFGPLSTVVELALLLLFGLNIGAPAALLSPLYGAFYLRCMYGSHVAAAVRVVCYVVVLDVVALVLESSDPMQQAATIWAWVLPSMAVTGFMVRTLAVSMRRLTTARDLSARLAATASDLLAAGSQAAVRTLVEDCVRGVVPGAALVRVETTETTGTAVTAATAAVFPLDEGGRHHGRLVVVPAAPLSTQQRETLRTLAAQATAAIQATELRAMLTHRASHDALTGLPNRALFGQMLTESLGHDGRTVAALFVDVDEFKTVNDSLGHTAGDVLLVEIADRLRRCVRPGDMAARMGGDEFAVLLVDVTAEEATAVAARILAVCEEPLRLDGRLFNLHCSIGIAHAAAAPPRAAALATELIRDADLAMYAAKARGKNRVERFSAALAEAGVRDRAVREQLSAALAGDELELYFQPVVSLADGRIGVVESLVRWHHPQLGLLLPAQFLPQAEQVGLLSDLDRWAVVAACRAAVTWAGPRPPAVAVNVSPRHLSSSWLVPTVRQALTGAGLPGERLVLEITEESVIADPVVAVDNLRECIDLGVRVAMDDFGAGHASLRRLGVLPISTVKIDRSLVAHETGPLVIRAVIGLAHALGLQVVAEGVEEPEQLAWLRACDCDAVQGYLLARPSPAAALDLSPRPVVDPVGVRR